MSRELVEHRETKVFRSAEKGFGTRRDSNIMKQFEQENQKSKELEVTGL
jgi:hypothetical protein